jgi:hypothetical protein
MSKYSCSGRVWEEEKDSDFGFGNLAETKIKFRSKWICFENNQRGSSHIREEDEAVREDLVGGEPHGKQRKSLA